MQMFVQVNNSISSPLLQTTLSTIKGHGTRSQGSATRHVWKTEHSLFSALLTVETFY